MSLIGYALSCPIILPGMAQGEGDADQEEKERDCEAGQIEPEA